MAEPEFGQLYRKWVHRYYQDVYRWCYRFTNDSEESKDLTQETFLAAFRHIQQFRGDASPKTWLLAIASRLCIKSGHKHRRRQALIADAPEPGAAFTESAEANYLQQAGHETVWRAIGALPPHERMAMILYYDEQLTYEEIGKAIGKSSSQIKNYLYRARQHIKRHLAKEENPE